MRSHFLAAALAQVVVAASLTAQQETPTTAPASALSHPSAAPVTLAPAPSDSIVKLAVKKTDYPDDDVVYLLDEGAVKLDAEGRGTRTFRQVVQIFKEEDVARWSERRFSYAPAHERLTLNWIRILKPDGTVVSAKPTHEQDSDIPAPMGNPVYADRRVKRISLSGLEAGMILDVSYTREELNPFRAGDYLDYWGVTSGAPILRSHYVVDLPSSVTPRIEEKNLLAPRVTTAAGGRTIYMWHANDVKKVKFEPFAADSNGIVSSVTIAGPTTWSAIAGWYHNYAKDRYTPSPALIAQVHTLVHGATTLADSISRVQRWVARDIRYVSISLGIGGYQPRMPDTVMTTKYGDCKDKTTLFITAMKTLGVTAYPVLLRSYGHVRRNLPSYEQFDHVIAAVKAPAGQPRNRAAGYTFVDLTETLMGYGEPLVQYASEFGLVVHPDGTGEEIRFPARTLTSNSDTTLIAGTLDTAGVFQGKYVERMHGALMIGARRMFENPLDSTQRARLADAVANRYFDDAKGDSLATFDGKDFAATPEISARIVRAQAATPSGNTMILMLPTGAGGRVKKMLEELTSKPRRFPIDAQQILGTQTSTTELRMTLPAGWTAKLPPPVRATGVFGSYAVEFTQDGQALHITRTVTGAEGIYAPSRVTELAEWFKMIAKDDAKFIVLERGS